MVTTDEGLRDWPWCGDRVGLDTWDAVGSGRRVGVHEKDAEGPLRAHPARRGFLPGDFLLSILTVWNTRSSGLIMIPCLPKVSGRSSAVWDWAALCRR